MEPLEKSDFGTDEVLPVRVYNDSPVIELDSQAESGLFTGLPHNARNQGSERIGVADLPVHKRAGVVFHTWHHVTVEDRHVCRWAVEPQLDVVHNELHGEEAEAD